MIVDALDRDGYVFALPIVERVLDFSRLVRAVGFEAALRLGEERFEGWEVHFLGVALASINEVDRREEAAVLQSAARIRSLLGSR